MTPSSNPVPGSPWRRLLALIGLGVVFVLYRPGAEPTLTNGVILPMAGLLCAGYVMRSLFAVALATALLAAAHTDLGSARMIEAVLYPTVAAIASAITLAVSTVRLVHYARETRAARRARRDER